MSRKNVRFSFGDPDQQVPIPEERRKSYPKETRWSKGYTSESSNEKGKISDTQIRKDRTGSSQQSVTSKSEERKAYPKDKRWVDGHSPEDSKTVRGETREEHSTPISSRNPKRRVSFSSDVPDDRYSAEIRRSSYPKELKWLMGFTFPPRLEKNKSYPGEERGYISGTSKQPTPTSEEEPYNNWERRVSFSPDVPDESIFDERREISYPKEMRWKKGFTFPSKLGKKKKKKEDISSRSDTLGEIRIEQRGSKVRFSFDASEASRPFFVDEGERSFPKEKRWFKGYTAERNDSSIEKQREWKEKSHLDTSDTDGLSERDTLRADLKSLHRRERRKRLRERMSRLRDQRVWDPRTWLPRDSLNYSGSLIIDDQLYHSADDGFQRQPSVYANIGVGGWQWSPALIPWFSKFWKFVAEHPEIIPTGKEKTYTSRGMQTEITGKCRDVNLTPIVDNQPWQITGSIRVAKFRETLSYATSTDFSPDRYPWLWLQVCMKVLGLDKDVLTPSSKEPVVLDDRVWADEVLEDNEEVVRNLPYITPMEDTEAYRKHIHVQDMLRKRRNPTFHRQLDKLRFI